MTIKSKTEEKEVLELIVAASEEFLQSAGSELNYQKITDTILYISGAKYAGFDLYDEDGSKFRTLALSGPEVIAKKISSLLGFNLLGKVWENNPVLAEKIKSCAVTHITTISEYAGDLVSKPTAFLVEKALNLGKLVIVKILKDSHIIGKFILVMPKNVDFRNENYIELYTRQLGLLITRNRSETKLRESEMQLRNVFSAVGDPLFLLDQKTGAILDVNAAACGLYGYTRDEMLKLKDIDMSAEPDKTKQATQEFSDIAVIPVRYHRKKDGNKFPVEITASLVELSGRKVIAVSMRDITVRKTAEEALQESEKKFRELAQMLPETVFEMNIQGILTFVNQQAFEIFGYTRQDFTRGIKALDMLIPGDRNKAMGVIQQLIQSGESSGPNEYTALRTDGSTFPILISSSAVFCQGKVTGIRGLIFDITERKRAEEALEENKKTLESYLNIAAEIIISLDNLGNITLINDSGHQLLGYNHDELIGKNWFKTCLPHEMISEVSGVFEKLMNGEMGNVLNHENVVKTKSGEIRTILWHNSLLKDSHGNITGAISSGEDITERKKVEEALHASEERFSKAFKTSNYAITITHAQDGKFIEINDAFTAITGFTWEEAYSDSSINLKLWANIENRDWVVSSLREGVEVKDKEYEFRKKNGEIMTGLFSAQIISIDNEPYILSSITDITERKKAEEEIRHLSFHDHLTGLYNRRFFEEELKRLDTERQLPLSFVMGDLNSLKIINDVFGHSRGDSLLKEVSEILKKVCRSDDILARWGGDEFVILLPKTSISDTEEIVERIKKECKKTDIKKIPVSLSLGASIKEKADQDIQFIVIDAESNMYKNKLAQKESLTSSIIFALEQALYEKSSETKEHTDRIHELALKLGKSAKLSSHQLDELSLLASLHDIGKIAISEKILLKKGKLTEKEWSTIRRHPEIGFNIAQSSPQIAHIAKSILSCHENWDGSGYPLGLKGHAIPVIARIILIVDAYDVMTSGRTYKAAISKEDAVAELRRCAGTQFDPELVDKVIEILSK